MPEFQYPVKIETKEGNTTTGWSEDHRDNDVLLIGAFIEGMANCLIKLNRLYAELQPVAALQLQMNLMLKFIRVQKKYVRIYRKVYESQDR